MESGMVRYDSDSLGDSSSDREKRRRRAPVSSARIEDVPGNRQLLLQKKMVEELDVNINNPFFRCNERMAKDTASIGGKEYINFSTYDYLSLNGSENINNAAAEAMRRYGTTAGASRMASGEYPPHRELEEELASFLGYGDSLVFLSGYMTNTTVISHLFGKGDLIALDALSHNSLIMGAVFSGADRYLFPHNDAKALDRHLTEVRTKYQRVLIVTEGLFGMDGVVGDLPALVEVKKRRNCFLMVDDAHSLGVLGKNGRGAVEHFGMLPGDIDVAMGTLSKSLCSCGGYIAGTPEFIHYMRYTAPGFLFSAAMPPPVAAAALAALRELRAHPEIVEKLTGISEFFVNKAKEFGLDVGPAIGKGIVPVMVGNSLIAGMLADELFSAGINVLPVVYPVVPEGAARLRFFLNARHSEEQVEYALKIIAEKLPEIRSGFQFLMEIANA